MSVLKIVKYPDKILLQIAEEVEVGKLDQYQALIRDMIEIMWRANGRGLAAPQVGTSKRIIIYCDDSGNASTLINPVVVAASGKIVSRGEGCLSIPNIRRNIRRARTIVVEGIDIKGNWVRIKPKQLTVAIALQHEIDHLNGITILTGKRRYRI